MQPWKEFLHWRCEGCGIENILLERQDDLVDDAGVFDRACGACGAHAAGTTIRPAHVAYCVTTRGLWHPERGSRHAP